MRLSQTHPYLSHQACALGMGVMLAFLVACGGGDSSSAVATRGPDSVPGDQRNVLVSHADPTAAFSATTGLVGHWTLDDTGSTLSDSVHDADGSTESAPGSLSGQIGGARSFDGVDDAVAIPATNEIGLTGQFSIAVWVKADPAAGDKFMRLISKKTQWDGIYGFELEYNPARQSLNLIGGGDNLASAEGVDLADGDWHHVVAVLDHDLARFFVDGQQATTDGTMDPVGTDPTPLYLGRHGAGGAHFMGALDDVRLYDYAMTCAQAKQLFTALGGTLPTITATNVNSDGLVAWWRMDAGTGSLVADASGNGIDGTLVGGEWLAPGAADSSHGVDVSFDDARVAVSNSPLLNMDGQISIAAWIKTNSTDDAYMRILSRKTRWDAPQGYELEYNPARGYLNIIGSGADVGRASNVAINDGQWHHVVGIIDHGQASIYVDGVDVTSDRSVSTLRSCDEILRLGFMSQHYGQFKGQLDEVRLYDRPLTPGEISTMAKSQGQLVAYYRLDEGYGNSATDGAGQGAPTGSISGGIWAPGVHGNSFGFADSGAVVSLPDSSVLRPSGTMTLSAWVRINDRNQNSFMRLISQKDDWTDATGYEVEYNPASNRLTLVANGTDTASADNVDLDTGWHHIAISANGTRAAIYVDGTDVTSDGAIAGISGQSGATVIGAPRHAAYHGWNGHIDDLRIYDYALDQQQIAMLAGNGLPSNVHGPFTHYTKLLDWDALSPDDYARNLLTEQAHALPGADVDRGDLNVTGWAGDSSLIQGGSAARQFGNNSWVGPELENFWIGLRDWQIELGTETSPGVWTWAKKTAQDAHLIFGFIDAPHASSVSGSAIGNGLGEEAIPHDAVVVVLPYRNMPGGGTAFQLDPKYRGNPLAAGVWQVPAGLTLAQAQAVVSQRGPNTVYDHLLADLSELSSIPPSSNSLSFHLSVEAGNGKWQLLIDTDGDLLEDIVLSSQDRDHQKTALRGVNDDRGLVLSAKAAGAAPSGKIMRSSLNVFYKAYLPAPSAVASHRHPLRGDGPALSPVLSLLLVGSGH